jgi:hypothetical protein
MVEGDRPRRIDPRKTNAEIAEIAETNNHLLGDLCDLRV